MKPIRVAIILMACVVAGLGAYYLLAPPADSHGELAPLYEAPPEDALRVLFIGNSHTYGHDVPGQLQHLGAAADTPIWVQGHLIGGATLRQHLHEGDAARLIASQPWDFVVLQEQSFLPATRPKVYQAALREFIDLAKASGATPVVYATWPRARWNAFYKQQAQFGDPATLLDALNRAFSDAAKIPDVELAPVGVAWTLAARTHPQTQLYSPDGNHASLAGAYLAGCVFYRVLTGRPVTGNAFTPDGLDSETARALQKSADQSPKYWATQLESRKPPRRSLRFRQGDKASVDGNAAQPAPAQ